MCLLAEHHHHHDEHTHHHGRHLPEIERLITAAELPSRAEAWSLAVFRQLAEAEGRCVAFLQIKFTSMK